MMTEKPNPLAKLREPFPHHQISKLPKPTKAQTDAVKANFKTGIRCKVCGAWHHPDVVHLDYVGHAAATDRLLDTDIEWTWEPLAVDALGLPAFDQNGGLWIKLTVCGVTRLGYGSADGKQGGDAKKEIIGDAIRNAGMRFGMALDLWHKGDLHLDEDEPKTDAVADASEPTIDQTQRGIIIDLAKAANVNIMTITESYGIPNIDHLTVRQGKAIVKRLNDEIAVATQQKQAA